MLRQILITVLIALGSVASTAHAGGRDALTTFTRGLKGLEGQFTQQVFDSKGKRKEQVSGRLALSAPSKFRWEYLKPYPQLIVADGRKVWIYDPDLKQAAVRPQGPEEQNSPLVALLDPQKLDRRFHAKDGGTRDGLDWLVLTPKTDADTGFQEARLGFDRRGLAKMHILDAAGQRTEIAFTGWKRNPAFASKTFRFTPPKGTDVVGEGG